MRREPPSSEPISPELVARENYMYEKIFVLVKWSMLVFVVAVATVGSAAQPTWSAEATPNPRKVISLDGVWQVYETKNGESVPSEDEFTRTVPVPGLVDLAEPRFAGLKDRCEYVEKAFVDYVKPEWKDVPEEELNKKEPVYYYYRKTFKIEGPLPDVARLKLHKIRFGCRVYLNGDFLGERSNCFTPLYFDVLQSLKGSLAENELLIRVGSHELMSNGGPFGGDGEIRFHYPGIYDSVELLLSGSPYIENVQVAPSLKHERIQVQATVVNTTNQEQCVALTLVVREAKTGKEVARKTTGYHSARQKILARRKRMESVQVPLPGARPWSPEDPFLYTLEVLCQTFPDQENGKPAESELIDRDALSTRFGMREFTRDSHGIPVLNGQRRFLRGTNLCIHRLFEDSTRGTLPWDKEWVRKVIRAFKSMHWDSVRYCVGFPPEIWYEVADEEGLLVQDEFSIWHGKKWPKELTAENLIPQFRDWMHERWNHPSVVIWDAQNETFSAGILPQVVARVRGEDLSDRPWDFGYDGPQRSIDFGEEHIYYFLTYRGNFDIQKRNLQTMGDHFLGKLRQHPEQLSLLPDVLPRVINEYGWLWLTREGKATILSRDVYAGFLGKDSTTSERREFYARVLAMQTECFRITRAGSGVQHFCGLASSREKSYTSDNFLDLRGPTFEPHFYKYVRDSFSPMGLMVDLWEPVFKPGEEFEVPVYLVNDLGENWSGEIKIAIVQGDRQLATRSVDATVISLLRGKVATTMTAPKIKGRYEVVAQLMHEGKPVRSYRLITVKDRRIN